MKIINRSETAKPIGELPEGQWFVYSEGLYRLDRPEAYGQASKSSAWSMSDRSTYSVTIDRKTVVQPVDVEIYWRPTQPQVEPFKE